MNRREFILSAGALGACAATRLQAVEPETPINGVRFGIVTDLHYASINPDPKPVHVVGRRFYRESVRKLDEAVSVFNRHALDFAIELGDFKDLTENKTQTLDHLDAIERSFARFQGPRYHIFGNHDFDCLTPADLAAHLTNDGQPMTRGYYSFVRKGVTFIVLDCCYRSDLTHYSCNNPWDDANVPPEELAWLEQQLTAAQGPVIVMTHQRLDPSAEPRHLVKNATAVRALMEKSGKVKLVLTGHQHLGSFYVHNDIPYYSLIALVCDSGVHANSFAEVTFLPDGSFSIMGYGNAVSYNCGKGRI